MNNEEIFKKVQTIVAEKLGAELDKIELSAKFAEDLGADSLDIVELVMALEEEFEISIPDAEAEKILTIGDAVKYIENNKE